jgi:hypothetical protein
MKLHRSGLIGLALSLSIVAACEDKTDIVIPPPPDPALTLNLVPDNLDLFVGGTGQLVAVVSGGAAGTPRTATFTSSNEAVATVDANGLVTGVSPGSAQITARATADNAVADVSNVTVSQDPATVPPTVSIKSVTVGNTLTPVPINNVMGQIDITANLDVPQGAQISAVEWLIDDTVVCRQTFSTGSADLAANADEAQAQVELVCSVNTAEFDAGTGVATFLNGPHQVRVRVIGAQGTVVAEAPPTQFSQLVFNNVNFIVANIASSRGSAVGGNGPRSLAPAGSLWHAGDITFELLSVNFGAPSLNIQNATVFLTSSGLGVTGAPGCVTTNSLATDPTISSTDGGAGDVNFPGCAAGSVTRTVAGATGAPFSVTFPENAAVTANGLANVEEIWTITITSVTAGGQAGPICINPDPVANPAGPLCGVTALPGGTGFVNPLRVDNLAPRITQLNVVRANQYFNEAFVPSHTVGSAACIAPCARTVDYGVDRQAEAGNATFQAGAALASLVDVTAGFGPLPETQVSTTNLFQLTIRDALGNSRVRIATADPTTTTATNALGAALLFGIDNTAPTLTITAGPPNLSTNCPVPPSNPAACAGLGGWVVSFSDAGVGPSGFNVNPVSTRLERILSTGTVCLHPDTGAAVVCATNAGFVADDGISTIPAVDGYYQLTVFVSDAAGNRSAETVRLTLRDVVAPVVGGIASPATITGGGAVSFSSSLTDNVELGDLLPHTRFNGFELAEPRQTIGTYGVDVFNPSDAGVVTIASFIHSVEGTSGAGLPAGGPTQASVFGYAVRDVAGAELGDPCPAAGAADGATTQNCTLRHVNISAAVATSNPVTTYAALNTLNAANAAHGLFAHQAPSALTVCTLATGNCTPATTPKSTTLSVTLTGPAGTFANPFSRVNFYFQDASGRWVFIGQGTVNVTDNTVLDTRTYTFSNVWTPTNHPQSPGAVNVIAIGVNATGAALVSQVQVVNLIDS